MSTTTAAWRSSSGPRPSACARSTWGRGRGIPRSSRGRRCIATTCAAARWRRRWSTWRRARRTCGAGGAIALSLRAAPNPAASTVRLTLRRAVAAASAAEDGVRIFDVAGRQVRRLELAAVGGAGETTVAWDGRDAAGRAVPAGLYFARARWGDREAGTRSSACRNPRYWKSAHERHARLGAPRAVGGAREIHPGRDRRPGVVAAVPCDVAFAGVPPSRAEPAPAARSRRTPRSSPRPAPRARAGSGTLRARGSAPRRARTAPAPGRGATATGPRNSSPRRASTGTPRATRSDRVVVKRPEHDAHVDDGRVGDRPRVLGIVRRRPVVVEVRERAAVLERVERKRHHRRYCGEPAWSNASAQYAGSTVQPRES